MLNDMSAFVRRHGRSRDTALIVDSLTEVDSLCLWIVMVCKTTRDASDLYIGYSVVCQHFAGYFRSSHPVVGRNVGIFLESALKHALDNLTENHDHDHYDPDRTSAHKFNVIIMFNVLRAAESGGIKSLGQPHPGLFSIN